MGHSLDMEHRNHGSVFIRQFHHGLVQSSLQLGQVRFAHRAARGRAFQEFLVVLNAGIDVIQAQLKTPAAFLEKIERHVHGNGMNPCVKRRLATEPADRAVGFGEDILQKIVRVLVVRGHVVNQAVKTRGIFDDQFIEGAGIARLWYALLTPDLDRPAAGPLSRA